MSLHSLIPELRRCVAEGEYVVDPHEVAEAIMRQARLSEAQRFSRMLEAAKAERLAIGVEQA